MTAHGASRSPFQREEETMVAAECPKNTKDYLECLMFNVQLCGRGPAAQTTLPKMMGVSGAESRFPGVFFVLILTLTLMPSNLERALRGRRARSVRRDLMAAKSE